MTYLNFLGRAFSTNEIMANSNRIGIYNQSPNDYRVAIANSMAPSYTVGYPYCNFCSEKKAVQAEIKELATVVDISGRRSVIPKSFLFQQKESISAKLPLVTRFKESLNVYSSHRARAAISNRSRGKPSETGLILPPFQPTVKAKSKRFKCELVEGMSIALEGDPTLMMRRLRENSIRKRSDNCKKQY